METLLESPVASKLTTQATEDLTVRAYYRPSPRETYWGRSSKPTRWCYSRSEQDIILNLAAVASSSLSTVAVKGEDKDWYSEGGSVVRRYELEDGTAGYFKPLQANSRSESDFRDYGMSSLAATISEINSYRMAQLLGGEYAELVPLTALRRIGGETGTLQLEVAETMHLPESELMADHRRAALFDFVIGNLDRHGSNFLYGADASGRRRIKLIDNSFSFPSSKGGYLLNQSVFGDNMRKIAPGGTVHEIPFEELELRAEEVVLIQRARAGVEGWLEGKTIGIERGKATLRRIDHLLKAGKLGGVSDYFDGLSSYDY